MITRPTTAQILEDCAREVRETVAPAVTDPTVRVRLEMLEQLLASCAVRAGFEMAWMAEETAEMVRLTEQVVTATADARVAALHATWLEGRTDSLVLEDRIADYDRAGRAFAAALEVAMHSTLDELVEQVRVIIGHRRDHETSTRPGFYLPGRS